MQSDDEKNNWLFEILTASPQIVPKDSIIKAVSLARSENKSFIFYTLQSVKVKQHYLS